MFSKWSVVLAVRCHKLNSNIDIQGTSHHLTICATFSPMLKPPICQPPPLNTTIIKCIIGGNISSSFL